MTLLGHILALPFRLLGGLAVALLQPDKQAHFYWGATMGLAGLWMGWLALVIITGIAAAKEFWDLMHPPHECELWDFLATCAGGCLAIALITIHLHGWRAWS